MIYVVIARIITYYVGYMVEKLAVDGGKPIRESKIYYGGQWIDEEDVKAVVAVDFTGQAVKIREIREICDRNGLIFIEDAAHAIGTKYDGKCVGSLADMPEIILQKEIPESDTCRHLYIIRLDLEKLSCTRRQFFDAMSAEGVQPQIHYIPVYWFPYYRNLGYEKGLCPNAEEVYKGIMSIPLYPKMTDQDVEDVIHAVKKVVENYAK